MEELGQQNIWTYCDDCDYVTKVQKVTKIRKANGHQVESFLDLAKKVAELQFRNPNQVLMFRGQVADFHNSHKNTTLRPSLFRPEPQKAALPNDEMLAIRYEDLTKAEATLSNQFKKEAMLGVDRLKRYRILRWAILQHYEVCLTPLLDVTRSLRVAASFASLNAGANVDVFLYVLAVPHVSGAITTSAEAGLQTIRLASVCPPAAMRPHLQEAYLLGEYPEMADRVQNLLYKTNELDFGRRLLAKFRFNPTTFWKNDAFPPMDEKAFYPKCDDDPLRQMCDNIKVSIGSA